LKRWTLVFLDDHRHCVSTLIHYRKMTWNHWQTCYCCLVYRMHWWYQLFVLGPETYPYSIEAWVLLRRRGCETPISGIGIRFGRPHWCKVSNLFSSSDILCVSCHSLTCLLIAGTPNTASTWKTTMNPGHGNSIDKHRDEFGN
jgi:hypothetical protein